jgi:hypothetical protein
LHLFFIFDEIIVLKKLFLICLIYCQLPAANCQVKYFQQQVNYRIDVSLNDIDNTLDGFEIIDYTNNSPDTLQYIWFHLWPNAYKNDRTALSEQLLQLGRTDFYFSDEAQRGYINRLDFKVNNVTANLEDHPQYIDVAKLILPSPLAPGQTIKISTPFHEKLPYNFSRGGYVGKTYQITQWYPKPAVYDNKGWHPMPYLDQGEFYSEFGNFNVSITVPEGYLVASTGVQVAEEKESGIRYQVSGNQPGKNRQQPGISKKQPVIKKNQITKDKNPSTKDKSQIVKPKEQKQQVQQNLENKKHPISSPEKDKVQKEATSFKTITLKYQQDSIHDFAWFADKNFVVKHDTLKLASGRIINVYAYFTHEGKEIWKNSISFLKDAITTRSAWLGEYPYNTVSAVEAKMGFSGGMEYPTITSISPMPDEKSLDMTMEHEVGHNWNYGILATNERDHPWMDEGINTYFDNRYSLVKYDSKPQAETKDFIKKRIPEDEEDIGYRTEITNKKDQPIETKSQDFSEINYDLTAYYKTGLWMKKLETHFGKPLFDSCLHEYYNRWKFKHPYPEDFKKVIEDVSNQNVDSLFSLLNKKGYLQSPQKKKLKVASLFNFRETDKYNYLFLSPAVGYNYYDKLMIGGLIHNYTLPQPRFHFFVAPMYGTGSKAFTGIARAGYNFLSYGFIRKAEIILSGAKFTINDLVDSTGTKNFMGFTKLVPSIKLTFKNKNAISTVTKYVQWKTYFIEEASYLFTRDTINQIDIITYPKTKRYLNQLTLSVDNNRALYPYSGKLVAEQDNDFLRVAFDGNYYFNYAKAGGMSARIFAGKFIYLGDKTSNKQYATDRYHLNMTGPNGAEDYTYSNYFIGRNEFEKAPSQQIMIRDGGFKVRTDLLNNKIGKTDDWLAALNLKTDFPNSFNPLQVLPIKIPLKLFLDVGTYAEAWKKDAATGKFIYDAGIQLPLFKEMINIYVPLLYSKVYGDYFKNTLEKNKRFWQNISFSIDIQNFRFNQFLNIPDL